MQNTSKLFDQQLIFGILEFKIHQYLLQDAPSTTPSNRSSTFRLLQFGGIFIPKSICLPLSTHSPKVLVAVVTISFFRLDVGVEQFHSSILRWSPVTPFIMACASAFCEFSLLSFPSEDCQCLTRGGVCPKRPWSVGSGVPLHCLRIGDSPSESCSVSCRALPGVPPCIFLVASARLGVGNPVVVGSAMISLPDGPQSFSVLCLAPENCCLASEVQPSSCDAG